MATTSTEAAVCSAAPAFSGKATWVRFALYKTHVRASDYELCVMRTTLSRVTWHFVHVVPSSSASVPDAAPCGVYTVLLRFPPRTKLGQVAAGEGVDFLDMAWNAAASLLHVTMTITRTPTALTWDDATGTTVVAGLQVAATHPSQGVCVLPPLPTGPVGGRGLVHRTHATDQLVFDCTDKYKVATHSIEYPGLVLNVEQVRRDAYDVWVHPSDGSALAKDTPPAGGTEAVCAAGSVAAVVDAPQLSVVRDQVAALALQVVPTLHARAWKHSTVVEACVQYRFVVHAAPLQAPGAFALTVPLRETVRVVVRVPHSGVMFHLQ